MVVNLLELIRVWWVQGYDADYKASIIQTFVSKFKDRQLKKIDKKLKELDKIEKLTGQTTQ